MTAHIFLLCLQIISANILDPVMSDLMFKLFDTLVIFITDFKTLADNVLNLNVGPWRSSLATSLYCFHLVCSQPVYYL